MKVRETGSVPKESGEINQEVDSIDKVARIVESDLWFIKSRHKATGVKIKLSKNNDHDGYHTASNVARKATAFPL